MAKDLFSTEKLSSTGGEGCRNDDDADAKDEDEEVEDCGKSDGNGDRETAKVGREADEGRRAEEDAAAATLASCK